MKHGFAADSLKSIKIIPAIVEQSPPSPVYEPEVERASPDIPKLNDDPFDGKIDTYRGKMILVRNDTSHTWVERRLITVRDDGLFVCEETDPSPP